MILLEADERLIQIMQNTNVPLINIILTASQIGFEYDKNIWRKAIDSQGIGDSGLKVLLARWI